MNYSEFKANMRKAEEDGIHITGEIIISEDSFTEAYDEEARTYIVSSNNKAYQNGKLGYSIFASCKDGSDQGIRLEQYLAEEYGGKKGWKIENCRICSPWYAAQRDADDDWGTGSFNPDKAIKMAKNYDEGAIVAKINIDDGHDPICTKEEIIG